VLRFAAGLALLMALAGCFGSEKFGYVHVRRSFVALSGEYTFKLNNMELPGLNGAVSDAEVVIKQAAGPVKLELQHKTNRWVLCQFELRENRIVLATVSLDDRTVTCNVRD
jgi:hypothetical protein